MGYSNEVVISAHRQLEQENQRVKAENNRRLEQVYVCLPRVKEIDGLLRRSMVLAAQAAFAKGDEAVQIMEDAKAANLALQKERSALLAEHFPEGWLDKDCACERCGGSGYLGSSMCNCLRDLCRKEQKKQIGALAGGSKSFADFDLNYYPDRILSGTNFNIRQIMEKTLDTCRTYAAQFPEQHGNLL